LAYTPFLIATLVVFVWRSGQEKLNMRLITTGMLVFCLMAWPGVETANAYTQLCPGPGVPQVVGPIQNGSTCNLNAQSTTIDALFVGSEAWDQDQLILNGSTIFNNMLNVSGDSTALSVSPGPLLFTLDNTDSRIGSTSYGSGVGYTNFVNLSTTTPAFGPVYHFAYFSVTSEADFNALFGPGGNSGGFAMSDAANAYIVNNGGYSAFAFVGVEDLPWAGSDDWNDAVFAFNNVAVPATPNVADPEIPRFVSIAVPETPSWAMLLLGFAGLGFAAHRCARRQFARA
jgi:hypothetical protein